ncbi:MAG: 3-isopropylmalate dehydratase small subunit [Bacteroidales bacterium]
MSIPKFTILESAAVLMPAQNIDTDQIIPARFLKTTSREGFGENLFYDWRYNNNGEPIKEFVLNTPQGRGTILVAGHNFGCGSSREHAAWALADYGFRAVVSSFFADIFRNNVLNNGVLPVQVSEQFLQQIFKNSALNTNKKELNNNLNTNNSLINNPILKIDLMKKEILNVATGQKENFEINSYKQECLIKGQDDIDYLLSNLDEIEKYEQYKTSSY